MNSLIIFEASGHFNNRLSEPAKPEEKRSAESQIIIDPTLADGTPLRDERDMVQAL